MQALVTTRLAIPSAHPKFARRFLAFLMTALSALNV
jgi:hypothetical protein